jgi:predicted alpha-1,2-mannosidase
MNSSDHASYQIYRIKFPLLAFILGVVMGLHLPLHAYTLQPLTTNVNMFCGTAGGGNAADLFPGAVVPFGMIQWSPDTSTRWPGNYLYSDTQIRAFGLTHASGAGCDFGGDCGFTPFLGTVSSSPYTGSNFWDVASSYFSTFSHADETASPGYYSVQFTNGIRTELTVTTRTGFGRFTYPSGNSASMLINAGGDGNGTINASIQINPSGNEINGWTQMPGMCGTASAKMYFDIVFDHSFAAYGVWSGSTFTSSGTSASGSHSGAYLNFNLPSGGAVLARTAVSYVSIPNAQANLQAESPSANFSSAGFDAMSSAASNNWNGYLNKIQVSGGTAADTATFYTMLYHCLQAPEVVSDVNGQFTGLDNYVHTFAGHNKYGWFSGWDIYRSECQLIAVLDPASASDMAQSLVLDAQYGGGMPRWSVATADSGIMLGDPATPIIAGMYAFGATNFNTTDALAAMVKAAVNPVTKIINGGTTERDANRDYLNLGFVPEYQIGGYAPVSMTLEYCSADFALARFAQAVGDTTNYSFSMNRAQNWRNHFNAGSRYFQMRRSDGLWSPGFVSNASTYDNYNLFAEGTGSQYIWMVPFNLNSLITMMGGPAVAAARLNTFFTQINDNNTGSSPYAYLGNEPCAATPWVYNFVGQPYKTSAVVRSAITQLYSTSTSGLPGNDDLGQTSSWYVWAALGMYPGIPGDDVLVLHGPLFPQAIIHLTNGNVTITGSGAADSAQYIQSLTVNGLVSNSSWVRYTNIANGGTLAYVMGTTANTSWGTNLLLAPPSYTNGMNTPLSQNYYWGTGLESDEIQLSATNTVDTVPPAGGLSNVGPISGALVPELGVRNETSQSGSGEIMYSGNALGGTSVHAYMEAFDLTRQNIMLYSGMYFSYWVYPQSSSPNSAYVALDIIFTDGTTLRNSGLMDQNGFGIDPTSQGSHLTLDTWNYVSVDLTPLAGKTVSRIDCGFDRPNSTGAYRGYVDDLGFTTPATISSTNNLGLNQPASADSQQAGNLISYGNDGNIETRWCANDGNLNHWWQVNLGAVGNLQGDEVIWEKSGDVYDYTVAVSLDNTNWTTVVDKTANPSAAPDQVDVFPATGRYVRITVTGLSSGQWASFYEFRVFGNLIALPSAPVNLQAMDGYDFTSLDWATSVGATSYNIKRSTSSGTETIIANTTSTNYLDTRLATGTRYFYVVSAVNIQGQGGNSREVSATSLAPEPGSYTADILSNNPVACWQLNETGNPTSGSLTAYDYVGGYNGAYGNLAMNGNPLYSIFGPRPPAYPGFSPTNTALQTFRTANSGVMVPALNLSNTNETIVAWIYPTNTEGGNSAIFVDRTGGTTAGFCYSGTLTNGAYPLGYIWNDNDPATWGWAGSGVFPPVNQWSLVALTITASNATVSCWSSTGVQQGVFVYAHNNMTFAGTSQIGNDGAFPNKNFLGSLAGVAVFNYAVSSNALQTLYSAAINRPRLFLANPFTLPGVVAGQSYAAGVATNASDPYGDPITFGTVSGPAWLNVAGNGNVTGTPLSSNVGVNRFVLSATDSVGLSNSATMNLMVTAEPAIVASALIQGNGWMLNWGGGIGPYQVQMATNLVSPVWQNVGPSMGASNLQVSPTNGAIFYRIEGQ